MPYQLPVNFNASSQPAPTPGELTHAIEDFASNEERAQKVISLLERGANPNERDPNHKGTALINVVVYADFFKPEDLKKIIDLLIKKGALLDEKNDLDFTALMYAANCGREDVAKQLVAAGADISITTKDGATAGILAQEMSFDEDEQYLRIAKMLEVTPDIEIAAEVPAPVLEKKPEPLALPREVSDAIKSLDTVNKVRPRR